VSPPRASYRHVVVRQRYVAQELICDNKHRSHHNIKKVKKAGPYSITERRVPAPIPVLGSQPAGDVSHKPGGRLPLLSSARPAVTLATLKKAATNFAAW